MKFNEMGLSRPLLDSLHAMGFSDPTPIQEQAIPLLLQGHDLIGQAKTGTGKTAAFGLPILEAWLQASKGRSQANLQAAPSAPAHSLHHPPVPLAHVSLSGAPYHSRAPIPYSPAIASPAALILVPTRELAAQVNASLQSMAKTSGARVVTVYGGVEMRKQLHLFRAPVDVLVGTPGRTLDHMRHGSLKLDRVRTVVLDEADRMLDMGFIHDVVKILDSTPHTRQTLLFSATMPREIASIARKYMKNPQTIKVSEDSLAVESIRQLYVRVDSSNRFGMLLAALHTLKPFLALVFCRTKHDAKKLSRLLAMNGISADALHGNLRQNARERAMTSFRAGKIDVMVATDIASRGIDVREITHVFNYELPADPMTYVHRIGRTGRAGSEGTAISFVSGNPHRAVEIIENATGSKMEELVLTPEPAKMPERMEFHRGDTDHPNPGGRGRPHEGGSSGRHEWGHGGRRTRGRDSAASSASGPRPPPGAHHHSSHRRY